MEEGLVERTDVASGKHQLRSPPGSSITNTYSCFRALRTVVPAARAARAASNQFAPHLHPSYRTRSIPLSNVVIIDCRAQKGSRWYGEYHPSAHLINTTWTLILQFFKETSSQSDSTVLPPTHGRQQSRPLTISKFTDDPDHNTTLSQFFSNTKIF